MKERSGTVKNVILVVIAAIVIAAVCGAWYYINGSGLTFKYVAVNTTPELQAVIGNDSKVANAFRSVLRRSSGASSTDVNSSQPDFYLITHSGTSSSERYDIYIDSILSREAYICNCGTGEYRKIRGSDFPAFFSLAPIAKYVYKYTDIPEAAIDIAGQRVSAQATQAVWRYALADGSFGKTDSAGQAVDVVIGEGMASMSFDLLYNPALTVTITRNEVKIYEGDPRSAPVIDYSAAVSGAESAEITEVRLNAYWKPSPERDFYGSAEYVFIITTSPAHEEATEPATENTGDATEAATEG